MSDYPHQNQPVYTMGKPLDEAKAAVILLHGRYASPQDILMLGEEFLHPDLVFLAPQAENSTWYPYGFMEPLHRNEPGISSGIAVLKGLVDHLTSAGFPTEKILLGGFSQGACLSLEFSARHAGHYGGIFALSGGLIGPDDVSRDYPGSLEGVPVFLGCSDVDFHIPKERVHHSTEVLSRMGADVTERIYPGMGHTTNQDEIDFVRGMVERVLS